MMRQSSRFDNDINFGNFGVRLHISGYLVKSGGELDIFTFISVVERLNPFIVFRKA